jgi:hypothetical protein
VSKEVYVKYTVPVFARVDLDNDGRVPGDGPSKVVVLDEALSDILAYEDEEGHDIQFDLSEDELNAVDAALGGEWPAWQFDW